MLVATQESSHVTGLFLPPSRNWPALWPLLIARWCQTEKARPSGGELDTRSPHNLPNHLRCCWKTKIPWCFMRTMSEKLCFITRGYQGKQHMKRAVFTGGAVCAMCRKRALILPSSSRFSLPQLFPTGRSAWPSQVRLGSAEKTPHLCATSLRIHHRLWC